MDVYKPVGDWKKENNSTAVTLGDRKTFIEYSDYWEVPRFMERWLEMLNGEILAAKEPQELVRSYARLQVSFAAIHPFWDGNGRVVRLIANLPCLKAGQPPIIIPHERRYDYLMLLADYTRTNGVLSLKTPLISEDASFHKFCAFCEECWQSTMSLVAEAHTMQQKREERQRKANVFAP